jgi:hypothetical protein
MSAKQRIGRRFLAKAWLAVALGAAGEARAADPPAASAARPPAAARRASSGDVKGLPTAAILDGSWQIAQFLNSEAIRRTYTPPWPQGTIASLSSRVLYGGSWTALVGLEGAILLTASGGKLHWVDEARYVTDWVVGYDLPACPRPGAHGGCGVGIGVFSVVQLRPRGWRVWLEAGGGWLQQRVWNDETRTVAETTWVLSPATALYEAKAEAKAVSVRARFGPGTYFGMHNAHVHPTRLGVRRGLEVPWHGMYPLDAGGGPGGRGEVTLTFFRRLALDAELTTAAFVLGGPVHQSAPEIAPLGGIRQGITTWRKGAVAIGWDDKKTFLAKASLAYVAQELSSRPLTKLGQSAVMLRFEIPMGVPGDKRER